MKILRAAVVVAMLTAGTMCSVAGTVTTWTLNNIKFDNGNVLNGSFSTDLSVPDYITFNVTVTGPATAADFTAVTAVNSYLPGLLGFASPGFAQYVDLYLASPLTNAGGVVNIASGFDCPSAGRCGVLVTSLGPDVVSPEPSALLLGAAGLGWIALKVRRKSRA